MTTPTPRERLAEARDELDEARAAIRAFRDTDDLDNPDDADENCALPPGMLRRLTKALVGFEAAARDLLAAPDAEVELAAVKAERDALLEGVAARLVADWVDDPMHPNRGQSCDRWEVWDLLPDEAGQCVKITFSAPTAVALCAKLGILTSESEKV